MRSIGKGFFGVHTLLFDGMLVPQQVHDDVAAVVEDEDVANEISAEPTPSLPTPATTPPPLQGNSYIRPIFEKHFNSIWAFSEKGEKELEEEDGKRKGESLEKKAANKQKINEEAEELKTHLQIFPNDEDDVYTEATPLALKVPVLDYQIHTKNNKPYYKIIRADGTHQLFLSTSAYDFLLNTLKTMFKKPNVEANIWKNQRGRYGLAKFKSWKLLESYGVHIITFTTTQMILLVERRYPLKRFTLEQMLNNVRFKIEEESEVSLELLRFVRRQQQEGYRPE
nr:hypothetical protein [Tanacetum cinerariifolium]